MNKFNNLNSTTSIQQIQSRNNLPDIKYPSQTDYYKHQQQTTISDRRVLQQ